MAHLRVPAGAARTERLRVTRYRQRFHARMAKSVHNCSLQECAAVEVMILKCVD